MLGSLGAPELAIILVIILLVFGVGRISGVGKELGSSIKEFRKAVKDEDKEEAKTQVQQAQVQQPAPPAQVQAPPPPAAPSQPTASTDSTSQEPQKNIF